MNGGKGKSQLLQRLVCAVVARILGFPAATDRNVRCQRDLAITMTDGAVLKADVYSPPGPGPHPTVLVRSPYGRRGPYGLLFGRAFAERGYRVVVQSCRGTAGSGGSFRPHFDERGDGLDTIGWIERQEWFDGRLALNGPSYLGGVQWAVADAAGPSLRAMATHVTYSNITGHWFPGGSFSLLDSLEWMTLVCKPGNSIRGGVVPLRRRRRRRVRRGLSQLPLGDLDRRVVGASVPFWHEIVDHPSADDPYWGPIDHSSRVAQVTAPVLQVGGWYDIFLPLQLDDHGALVGSGTEVRLVVGPWTHTAARGFAVQVTETLRWLDRHLRGLASKGEGDPGPVRLFVMGADEWRSFGAWPPEGYASERWYLHPGGKLSRQKPSSAGSEFYDFDPSQATPIVGGSLLGRAGGRRRQRSRERRSDVVVYTTAPLEKDVEVIGAVSAEIHAMVDLDCFDVFVRLCDVDRRGRSFNVCDGIERVDGSRRRRGDRDVWTVVVQLWPTAHRFRAGHRIRLQVSSGCHPRFARNLGSGEPLATGTSLVTARVEILRSALHPSAVVLPVRSCG